VTRGELKESEDVSISSGDLYVSLPSGTIDVVEVRVIDGTSSASIRLVLLSRFAGWFPNPEDDASGKPEWGAVDRKNGRLYVYPKSDDGYVLRMTVVKYPTFGDSDSTENPLVGTDDALVAYAAQYVFNSVQDFESAEIWRRHFEVAIASAIQTAQRRSGVQEQGVVRNVYGDESSVPPNWWLNPFVMKEP